jgi:cbb3-type cytochrome oxidase subunit 3
MVLKNFLAVNTIPNPFGGGAKDIALEGTIRNPLAPNLSPSTPERGLEMLSALVPMLLSLTIIIAAIIFFFVFLIGGIRWIMSGGDKAQVEAARGTLTNALIGLVIVLSLFAILKFIEVLFGIELLQIQLGKLKIS